VDEFRSGPKDKRAPELGLSPDLADACSTFPFIRGGSLNPAFVERIQTGMNWS
jgi:hypothetical protein